MKGTYVLLIELKKSKQIEIAKLGKIKFKKGFYAYAGSALNDLEKRIEHHFRSQEGLQGDFHWHIDYLLNKAKIKEVISAETSKRKECEIANLLAKNFDSIPKFGCSDCKCDSHLFFSKDFNKLKKSVTKSFEKVIGLPISK